MHRYGEALFAFRRRALQPSTDDALPALFVLEPGMYVAAAVAASWQPSATLQVCGGADSVSEPSVRATFEHAVVHLGARSIVLCAEGSSPVSKGDAAGRLLRHRRALVEDAVIGALLRKHAVAIDGLWFDTAEGDIHLWQPEPGAYALLSDVGLDRFLGQLVTRTRQPLPRCGAENVASEGRASKGPAQARP